SSSSVPSPPRSAATTRPSLTRARVSASLANASAARKARLSPNKRPISSSIAKSNLPDTSHEHLFQVLSPPETPLENPQKGQRYRRPPASLCPLHREAHLRPGHRRRCRL